MTFALSHHAILNMASQSPWRFVAAMVPYDQPDGFYCDAPDCYNEWDIDGQPTGVYGQPRD